MTKKIEIKWPSEPAAHNYPAAMSYLLLIYDEKTTSHYVDSLKQAIVSEFKAKDIFRASNLSLLRISNTHVKKNQLKIQWGDQLSPILLVRDSINGKWLWRMDIIDCVRFILMTKMPSFFARLLSNTKEKA